MSQSQRFSRLPETRIGHPAVPFAEEIATEAAAPDSMQDEYIAQINAKNLGGMLKSERAKIRDLKSNEKDELTSILMNPHASPFIREIIDQGLKEMGYHGEAISGDSDVEHPTSKELIDTITYQKPNKRYIVANNKFLNILQYLVHEQKRNASPDETEVVSTYKDKYEARLQELTRKNILPASIVDRRLYLLYETPVTSDPRESATAHGYHSSSNGAVIHEKQVGSSREEHIVFHELTHALASSDMTPGGDIVQSRGFYGPGELNRVFNEGVTEMITSALLTDESRGDIHYYPHEQNLIVALCECSNGEISSRDFVDAYFAGHDSEKDATWLLRKLRDVYSPDLITRIDRAHYKTSKKTLQDISQQLYRDWATIHATQDDAEKIATRMLTVEDGKLIAENFLIDL